jgi:hypothetical protein
MHTGISNQNDPKCVIPWICMTFDPYHLEKTCLPVGGTQSAYFQMMFIYFISNGYVWYVLVQSKLLLFGNGVCQSTTWVSEGWLSHQLDVVGMLVKHGLYIYVYNYIYMHHSVGYDWLLPTCFSKIVVCWNTRWLILSRVGRGFSKVTLSAGTPNDFCFDAKASIFWLQSSFKKKRSWHGRYVKLEGSAGSAHKNRYT